MAELSLILAAVILGLSYLECFLVFKSATGWIDRLSPEQLEWEMRRRGLIGWGGDDEM